jgi:hypothetical protein
MDYNHIDTEARERALIANTGYGDTAQLTDADARAAEHQVCVLKLREAFLNAHATDPTPNPDPNAAQMAAQAAALAAAVTDAEAYRDRVLTATGADVADVMAPILEANRQKAEQDFFDAEWAMTNVPDQPQDQLDALQVTCDRAEREAAVIDGWPPA